MLKTRVPAVEFDFDALRAAEFARLDAGNAAYLDFAASALYGASQVRAYADRLTRRVYGNPHSEHAPSRASADDLEIARTMTLAYFDADPDIYDLCFTANTSAALKLVAEAYPFGPRRGLTLSADNHNSVNGARSYARRAGADVSVLPLDNGLRLAEAAARLESISGRMGPGLLALPVQSNFSGVKHDLSLIGTAHALGFDVMLDAAGSLNGLSLREHPADFVALSFYKLFGLPTGVGALIAKKAALTALQRPWFAGGTVEFVSVAHARHLQREGHEGFEDGTPNFLNAGAVQPGFEFLARIPRGALAKRIELLTAHFLEHATALTHSDGSPLVRLYGPTNLTSRGGTMAFNVLARNGEPIPYQLVEKRARDVRVALRGGCFCNPGAAERAFGLGGERAARCFDALGAGFSVPAFQACLGPNQTVGALRVSAGPPTNFADLDRALALISSFAGDGKPQSARSVAPDWQCVR